MTTGNEPAYPTPDPRAGEEEIDLPLSDGASSTKTFVSG